MTRADQVVVITPCFLGVRERDCGKRGISVVESFYIP
jgi:hypothetical protein